MIILDHEECHWMDRAMSLLLTNAMCRVVPIISNTYPQSSKPCPASFQVANSTLNRTSSIGANMNKAKLKPTI